MSGANSQKTRQKPWEISLSSFHSRYQGKKNKKNKKNTLNKKIKIGGEKEEDDVDSIQRDDQKGAG